ncbi:MAG: CBS domain-containing protein [Saprospiraceae bacterium]
MNSETPIKKIVNTNVVFVNPTDTMAKVEEIFANVHIHHILVLENEDLKGVISKSDLLNLYTEYTNNNKLVNRNSTLAKDIMTPDPISLDVDDTVGLAADIFLSNKIHSIPILNGSKLAGIITNHDLIKFAFE